MRRQTCPAVTQIRPCGQHEEDMIIKWTRAHIEWTDMLSSFKSANTGGGWLGKWSELIEQYGTLGNMRLYGEKSTLGIKFISVCRV